MIKSFPKRAALGVSGALCLMSAVAGAQPTKPPLKLPPKPGANKTLAVSAPVYRATLQKALDELRAPRPGALGKVAASLDAKYAVRRADGQVQNVSGNYWSNFGRNLGQSKAAKRTQAASARQTLRLQIRALDEWTAKPAYQPLDAGKIVAGLAASGQIRVGPLWWQKAISDAWGAIVRAWTGFWRWLTGLFPSATPFQNTAAPSDRWLWFFFYVLVAGILGLMLWFLWRAFGGTWIVMWGKIWGRHAIKRGAELENEDAELLQLPPAELLSRAERFAAQGNFREALRHRYLSLLLDLDARGVWRYDARRTNWEHIAALGRSENRRELVAPLGDLTRRFDRVRYGGAACDDENWRRFDSDARGFETRAAPAQKAAAREIEKGVEMAR